LLFDGFGEDRVCGFGLDERLGALVVAGDVKYFTPAGGWTWFALEYDPAQRIFWGYVESGLDPNFGEFGSFRSTSSRQWARSSSATSTSTRRRSVRSAPTGAVLAGRG
jgi:hypothetical protein